MHVKGLRDLRKDPWFLVGLGITLLFGGIALFGYLFAPFDPWDISFAPISPPSLTHPLGTNDGGQDILSGLLYAVRNTVCFGFMSGFAALAIGVLAGTASGWFGGLADALLMRAADIVLAVPAIMILILTAAVFQPDPQTLAIILALLAWPTIAKSIRAQTLSLREGLHVRAARQMGGGGWHIIRYHLVLEMFPLYLIGFAAKTRMAVFMEASLAFLGLFDPGRKSLGMMIADAVRFYYMEVWWNWLMPPILCLSLIIMGVTFLAISLEKVLDPRLGITVEGRTP